MAEQAHERRRTALLDELRRAGGKALSVRELMQRAKLQPGERTDVKRALRDLAREGVLHRDGKRFSLRGAKPAAAPGGALAPARSAPRRPAGRNQVIGTI